MLICFLGHPRPDIRLTLTNRLDFSGQDVSPKKIDIVLPEDTMVLWIRRWMTALSPCLNSVYYMSPIKASPDSQSLREARIPLLALDISFKLEA